MVKTEKVIKQNNPHIEKHPKPVVPSCNSNISSKMLELLYSRQLSITNDKLDNYLSLEEIIASIQKAPDIQDYSKKKIVFNYALKELLQGGNGRETPLAYLYPIFYLENNKIQCKIYLMTPIEKNSVEVSRFYESCFQKSLSAIEIFLSQEYHSLKRINPLDFLYTLLKENRMDERRLSPFEHSIEEDLRTLCRKAFRPYNLISIDAFLHDVLSYGKKQNQIIEITPEYHINNTQLSIDSEGNIIHESETYYHYYCHLSSLDRFLKRDLLEISHTYGLLTLENEISEYSKTYSETINLNPTMEVDRTRLIMEILDSIPTTCAYKERDRKIIINLKTSSKILRRLFFLIPSYTNNRQENLTENCINRLRQTIQKTSSEKKELYPISLDSLLEECKPISQEQKLTIEREIRKVILEEFGSHEFVDESGNTLFFLLSPAHLSEVLFKAAELVLETKENRELYTIVKSIQKQLSFKQIPIDSGIPEDRAIEIQRQLESFEKKIQTLFTFQKIGHILFTIIVTSIILGSLGYIGFLKIKMNLPLRLFAGIPTGFLATMFIHRTWKKIYTKNPSRGKS